MKILKKFFLWLLRPIIEEVIATTDVKIKNAKNSDFC